LLLKALALQIGSQVSYNELSQMVQLDKETIEKYIEILEQYYIIFRINSFNRNIRNELKKSRKIFFFDTGVRNALIQDYKTVESRQDIGSLWENYIMSEVWKKNKYEGGWKNLYFWRTQGQQEIDVVIEKDGELTVIEIKRNPNAKTKFNSTFIDSYEPKECLVIHPENYFEHLI